MKFRVKDVYFFNKLNEDICNKYKFKSFHNFRLTYAEVYVILYLPGELHGIYMKGWINDDRV